jgi:hypothetical protein
MSSIPCHEQLIVRSFLLKVKRLYEELRPLAIADDDKECLRVVAETLDVVDDLLMCVENPEEWRSVARIPLQPALLLSKEPASASEVDDAWPLSP